MASSDTNGAVRMTDQHAIAAKKMLPQVDA